MFVLPESVIEEYELKALIKELNNYLIYYKHTAKAFVGYWTTLNIPILALELNYGSFNVGDIAKNIAKKISGVSDKDWRKFYSIHNTIYNPTTMLRFFMGSERLEGLAGGQVRLGAIIKLMLEIKPESVATVIQGLKQSDPHNSAIPQLIKLHHAILDVHDNLHRVTERYHLATSPVAGNVVPDERPKAERTQRPNQ